jgi:hypothetical protein
VKIVGSSLFALLLGALALFTNTAYADYYYHHHHACYHNAPHHYYHMHVIGTTTSGWNG